MYVFVELLLKCYLVVDGTTLVLTIPLGFSCPNGQWQYYRAGPRSNIKGNTWTRELNPRAQGTRASNTEQIGDSLQKAATKMCV